MRKSRPWDVYLIDGTYELFRHFRAMPSARDRDGHEVAAVRGVVSSVLGMISGGGATHVAVATDHVESFRNGLWPGYIRRRQREQARTSTPNVRRINSAPR